MTKPKAPIRAKAPKAATKKHPHKGLLRSLGSTIGGAAYGAEGGIIGATAGELLGNLFGWGDYTAAPVNYEVANNTTVGFVTPMAAQIPMMHTEDGSCRIRKREFVADVVMTNTFTTSFFFLNPADATTFPWLSKVASNFEQFKFLGLTFGYRSLTANALGVAGSPGMGSITVLTQYDVFDSPVFNKQQANNALFATSCKPSENMLHPVECDPEQTPSQPLYTGVNEIAGIADRDLRLNTLGYTSVCTTGAASIYNAGELWVTYDVMLYKPMVERVLPPISDRISIAEAFRRQDEEHKKDAAELFIDIPPATPQAGTVRRF
jgi:hypothetical protein